MTINCSLNGSGVGRCYDDDMMVVDWDHAPNLRCVLDDTHPDYDFNTHESLRDARHKYGQGRNVHWFEVPDTREGWAMALERWETMAFQKAFRDDILLLDFSKVRPKGQPIMGMQGRPSSGPAPLMHAFAKAATIKGSGLQPWLQAMYMDHYFAEPVLVGGARRAARMATKTWRDPAVLDFIEIKRPIEYAGLSREEVVALRKSRADQGQWPLQSFLWSSNNSVTVDREFWKLLDIKEGEGGYWSKLAKHARAVWQKLTECAYGDGTGEPGILNVESLTSNDAGWKNIGDGSFAGSDRYELQDETKLMLVALAKRAFKKPFHYIVNPCGAAK